MGSRNVNFGLLMALLIAASASAQDAELAEGKKLYDKQCAVCHGNVAQSVTGGVTPVGSQWQLVHAQVAHLPGETMLDVPMAPRWNAGSAIGVTPAENAYGLERIAVVPLYGPQLRGILGRISGTMDGYHDSVSFLKKMNGVKWDEDSLNKWITSSQNMVPGTYMFYSQKNADVRRRIIAYMKANP